jgi:PqqD family protein of HPr-rel-A system
LSAPNPKRWSSKREPALRWRTWGAHSVVFNPASGDTHLLNASAAAVLRILESRPSSVEELCEELSSRSVAPRGDSLTGEIEALLEELDELGLAAPARS